VQNPKHYVISTMYKFDVKGRGDKTLKRNNKKENQANADFLDWLLAIDACLI
jgi:hypothetical protein